MDLAWTIVPHTHWDREWYQPFEVFRLRLGAALDELLDVLESDPRFRCFTLDGQAVILEDYLELRPEQEPRVRALLEAGRLIAGPAYVLPDEYLAPQEALVRNLLIGGQVTRAAGGRPMAVGYQPDPFGHVAQLPQVLRGFGLDSLIFWRGLGEAGEAIGSTFAWRGPDGSTVLGVRQLGGYGSASQLGRWGRDGRDHGASPDDWEAVAIDRLQRFLDTWGAEVARDGGRRVLLCNGSDHEPAWLPLPRLVEAIRNAYPGIDVQIGSYEEHLAALRADLPDLESLPRVTGELRDGRDAHILRGIDSVRIDLKQANEHATSRLLVAEAIAALALLAGDAPAPRPALLRAWKLLLRNQPHDSISGCSVDPVHREMATRFAQVEQIAARVEHEALAALEGTTASWDPWTGPARTLVVANALADRRRGLLEVPLPDELAGRRGLVAVVGERDALPVQRLGPGDDGRLRAGLALDLDGFGRRTIRLATMDDAPPGVPSAGETAAGPNSPGAGARAVDHRTIENERYRVEGAADGTFTVTDRSNGRAVSGVGRLEDVADRGDEYDFCPLDDDRGWTSDDVRARVRVVRAGPLVAELEVSFTAALPARLSLDRRRRVGRVRIPVRTVARLVAGIERVELTSSFDNRALDHRLRALIPSPGGRDEVRAEGHFAVLRRPARPTPPSHPEHWAQLPQPTHHTTGFVAAGSVVVIGRGLPEYEALERVGGGIDLALTLVRSVGWLSRDDLATRPGGAGPAVATPDAQAQGVRRCEYAVTLDGDLDDGALVRASADYRMPMAIAPLRSGGPSGSRDPLVRVEGDVAFAALKPAETGAGVILRLYNPGPERRAFAVKGAFDVWRVMLDESLAADPAAPETIGPFEIVGLRLVPRAVEP